MYRLRCCSCWGQYPLLPLPLLVLLLSLSHQPFGFVNGNMVLWCSLTSIGKPILYENVDGLNCHSPDCGFSSPLRLPRVLAAHEVWSIDPVDELRPHGCHNVGTQFSGFGGGGTWDLRAILPTTEAEIQVS